MVEVRRFVPGDEAGLVLTAQQAAALGGMDWRPAVLAAAAHGPVWTVTEAGATVALAGLAEQWPGRAVVWAYINAALPARLWPALHRAALRGLAGAGYRRLEAATFLGWRPGERWLRLLGFECEGVARGYTPAGDDASLWARVRPCS